MAFLLLHNYTDFIKTKNSQSWKDAQKDIKLYKDKKIKEAPTVYVNGKKLKDPYSYAEYKKYLK